MDWHTHAQGLIRFWSERAVKHTVKTQHISVLAPDAVPGACANVNGLDSV